MSPLLLWLHLHALNFGVNALSLTPCSAPVTAALTINYLSLTQISELLERVANPHAHHSGFPGQGQHHEVLPVEDDFKMDFSDTLFSTLTQGQSQSNRVDFCKSVYRSLSACLSVCLSVCPPLDRSTSAMK